MDEVKADRVAGSHLIITVHGIQTHGQWQERLEKLVTADPHDDTIEFVNYKFGYFSIIAFMLPFFRWLVVRRFRNELINLCRQPHRQRIDLVGHSFGTHVIGWAVARLPEKRRIEINTVILAGSVLKDNFPWRDLIGTRVARVVNDCGRKDKVLLLSQFGVLFTGMAGRTGFSGMTSSVFRNRYSLFGHSGYFRDDNGKPDDRYMESHWVPLLKTDGSIPTFPSPEPRWSDAIVAALANNAELFKLTAYATPFLLLFGLYFYLYQEAARQRTEALMAQSRLLTVTSNELAQSGDFTAAKLVALEALPDETHGVRRPELPEALRALYNGYYRGREIEILVAHSGALNAFALSPDETKLLTGSADGKAVLWDRASKRKLITIEGHDPGAEQVLFNPNGTNFLTRDSNGNVRIWDLDGPRELRYLDRESNGPALDCAFSPDGTLLAMSMAGEKEAVRVFDTTAWKQIRELSSASKGPSGHVVFNMDGSLLATEHAIWNAQDWTLLRALEGSPEIASSLAFSADGTKLVISTTETIEQTQFHTPSAQVWNVESGALEDTFGGHLTNVKDAVVGNAAFSPDGTLLMLAGSDGVRVWDFETKQLKFVLHEGVFIKRAIFSSDGKWIATAGSDKTARIYDASSGAMVAKLGGHNEEVAAIAFVKDNSHLVTASPDGTLRLWRVDLGRREAPPSFAPLAHVITPAHETHVIGHDGVLWDMGSGRQLDSMKDQLADEDLWLLAASLNPAGTRIERIVGRTADASAYLWDRETGKRTLILRSSASSTRDTSLGGVISGYPYSADFSPDGSRFILASETPHLFDASSGKLIFDLNGHSKPVMHAVFSPDGTLIATASEDGRAMVWSATTGKPLTVLDAKEGAVDFVTFDAGGARVATTSLKGKARIWDARTGRFLFELEGESIHRPLRFANNGRFTVGVSIENDTPVGSIWNGDTGKRIAVVPMDLGERFLDEPSIDAVAFAPDNSRIVTYSDDEAAARSWVLFANGQQLVDKAIEEIPRCLSVRERSRLGLVAEPPSWCITGAGREADTDPNRWLGKWPYQSTEWKDWLIAKMRGEKRPMPESVPIMDWARPR